MGDKDWHGWHDAYDQPGSSLSRRLDVVREQMRLALDAAPAGPLAVLSVCAGQGRELIPVLAAHPRRDDAAAVLIELDPRNAERAADAARAAGLDGVRIVLGDAGLTNNYLGVAPVDVLLLCGVFGNVTDGDVERIVAACPSLCRVNASVIWTRHREAPDLAPAICRWFSEHGFTLRWLSDKDAGYGVGVHRFTGVPASLAAGQRLFTFVDTPLQRDVNA